jgi:hypothetical protein
VVCCPDGYWRKGNVEIVRLALMIVHEWDAFVTVPVPVWRAVGRRLRSISPLGPCAGDVVRDVENNHRERRRRRRRSARRAAHAARERASGAL